MAEAFKIEEIEEKVILVGVSEQDGDDDAHRSQGAEETGRGVAALIVFGEDGGEELHRTHAQQRADGVEDGEQGALLGVVGQNGLAGTGAAGLEGVADDPDKVQAHKRGIACPHHRIGDHWGDAVQHQNAGGHDKVADGHERAEFAELTVRAVHQRTDDRVGDGVAQAHGRDHDRGKQSAQRQYIAAEGGNVGKHKDVINIRGTVVQRKQYQLVKFGAIDAGRFCIFAHGLLLVVEKEILLKSPRRGRRGACGNSVEIRLS